MPRKCSNVWLSRYQHTCNGHPLGVELTKLPSPQAPEHGCYCHGLQLELARWDMQISCINFAAPGEVLSGLPVIHFQPQEEQEPSRFCYHAPLYKTTSRAGVLSTTGQSTNFILHLALPILSGTTADTWIQQGVAAVCADSS